MELTPVVPPDRTAADIAAAEQVWRLTIDHSPIGTALVSTDGAFLRANHALCQMLGYPAEMLLRRTFQAITHPDDLVEDVTLLEETLRGERSDYRLTKRYIHADGHVVWGDLSVALVRDPDGRVMHFVAQVVDITELRHERERLTAVTTELAARGEQLERSNRNLEHFAAVASHDLLSPLAVVRGYLGLLTERHGNHLDAEAAEWVTRAYDASGRMASLITALLEYAQPSGVGLDKMSVDLGSVAAEAVADLGASITEAGSQVTVQPMMPEVTGSQPLLRMLIANLVSNAVKHRDEDRVCEVFVSAEHAFDASPMSVSTGCSVVVLKVADNGPGIAPGERERIFELFERGSGAQGAGHGIGMATCRRIVDWHGGTISVTDTPGGGATVTVVLPAV